jgi:type I restriction enzyme S subunit
MRERLISIADQYLADGQGDLNAEQRLRSNDLNEYWGQLSEVLLGYQLSEVAIPFTHEGAGPDFRIERDGRVIWIEVITPRPTNVPEEWLAAAEGVRDFPHEAILLRWTAAIKAKAEVLIGGPDNCGYLANGLVAPEDSYVIAVNGRLLRDGVGMMDALTGISQFPFAVEATFAVGPLQIMINRENLQAGEPEHQRRYFISKPVGQPVPAFTFLDPRFRPISAIWATDVDEFSILDRAPSMAVVHNPEALNPIPLGLLPAQNEYVARVLDEERYQLDRVVGRMPPRAGVWEIEVE